MAPWHTTRADLGRAGLRPVAAYGLVVFTPSLSNVPRRVARYPPPCRAGARGYPGGGVASVRIQEKNWGCDGLLGGPPCLVLTLPPCAYSRSFRIAMVPWSFPLPGRQTPCAYRSSPRRRLSPWRLSLPPLLVVLPSHGDVARSVPSQRLQRGGCVPVCCVLAGEPSIRLMRRVWRSWGILGGPGVCQQSVDTGGWRIEGRSIAVWWGRVIPGSEIWGCLNCQHSVDIPGVLA